MKKEKKSLKSFKKSKDFEYIDISRKKKSNKPNRKKELDF